MIAGYSGETFGGVVGRGAGLGESINSIQPEESNCPKIIDFPKHYCYPNPKYPIIGCLDPQGTLANIYIYHTYICPFKWELIIWYLDP